MPRMLVFLLTLTIVCFSAQAQQATPTDPSASTSTNDQKQLHANAVQLVELTGIRKRLEDNSEAVAQRGKEEILRQFPNYDPSFAEEWAKRMQVRFEADDYIAVEVHVYETHFTYDELVELIQIQKDKNAGKQPSPSQHLQDKLTASAITLQSEMLGGFAQVGAKLGGEIGAEIGKEHPEWMKQTSPSPSDSKSPSSSK